MVIIKFNKQKIIKIKIKFKNISNNNQNNMKIYISKITKINKKIMKFNSSINNKMNFIIKIFNNKILINMNYKKTIIKINMSNNNLKIKI